MQSSVDTNTDLKTQLNREKAERERERTERESEREAEKEERERLSADLEREKLRSQREKNESQSVHMKEMQVWVDRVKAADEKYYELSQTRDAAQQQISALRTEIDTKSIEITAFGKKIEELNREHEKERDSSDKAHSDKYERLLREMKGLKERSQKAMDDATAELNATK